MSGATPEKTAHYFEREARPLEPHSLGRTGLQVSSIGFGGYRITDESEEHGKALKKALRSGCNLVDTSTNYTDGGSERLVGKVLGELVDNGDVSREEVVLVTKGGYCQGEILEEAYQKELQGSGYPEMVKIDDQLWHNIHPNFLEDQISRSLERLGTDTLDVFLLHNPEYFLKQGGSFEDYYDRIARAFEHLEQEVDDGRIQWYGVSSNTFPDKEDSPHWTSLKRLLEIARERFGDDHHFGVIQFPFNLFEYAALLGENNAGKSVVDLAKESGLGILANRPLNSLAGGQIVRLVDFPGADARNAETRLKAALDELDSLEQSFSGGDLTETIGFRVAKALRENVNRTIVNLHIWHDVLAGELRPVMEKATGILNKAGYSDFRRDWIYYCEQLFEACEAYFRAQAAEKSDQVKNAVEVIWNDLTDEPTLSRKVTRLYRSLPGLDCILVGMRRESYVDDILSQKETLDPETTRTRLAHFHSQVKRPQAYEDKEES